MSATFSTTPTTCDSHRSVHPSLLPTPRPTLVEVGDQPPASSRRRLPGGATIDERRPHPGAAELRLAGEVDEFDRGALIDAFTAAVLEGALHLRVDGSDLSFVDLRVLDALCTVAIHCRRLGGSFEFVDLREPYASLWAAIAPDAGASATIGGPIGGPLDGRVVPLHAGARPA